MDFPDINNLLMTYILFKRKYILKGDICNLFNNKKIVQTKCNLYSNLFFQEFMLQFFRKIDKKKL